MGTEFYNYGLTIMSVVVVVFGSWLVGMMLLRMKSLDDVSAQDVASLVYVLSTVLVFLAVATTALFDWPRWITFGIVFLKMVSVIAVTIWFRIARTGAE